MMHWLKRRLKRWLQVDELFRDTAKLRQQLRCLQAELDQVYHWTYEQGRVGQPPLPPPRPPQPPLKRLRTDMEIARALAEMRRA